MHILLLQRSEKLLTVGVKNLLVQERKNLYDLFLLCAVRKYP